MRNITNVICCTILMRLCEHRHVIKQLRNTKHKISPSALWKKNTNVTFQFCLFMSFPSSQRERYCAPFSYLRNKSVIPGGFVLRQHILQMERRRHSKRVGAFLNSPTVAGPFAVKTHVGLPTNGLFKRASFLFVPYIYISGRFIWGLGLAKYSDHVDPVRSHWILLRLVLISQTILYYTPPFRLAPPRFIVKLISLDLLWDRLWGMFASGFRENSCERCIHLNGWL